MLGQERQGPDGDGHHLEPGRQPGEMGDSLTTVDLSYNALSVDAGMDHVCAVVDTSSGRVQCWGGNQAGQLGYGDTQNRGDGLNEMGSSLQNVNLGSVGILAVSAGDQMTCAIDANKKVLCFGINVRGQLAWARPNTSATTARTCHPPRPTSRSGNRSREADAGPTSSRHSTPRSQGRRWTRHRTTSATTTTCNSSPMAAPWSRTQTKRTTTSRPRSSQMGSGPSRPRSPTPRPCSRHQWPSTTTTGSTSSQRIPPTTPPARTSCSRPRSRDDGSPRSSPVRKCQPRRHGLDPRWPRGHLVHWLQGHLDGVPVIVPPGLSVVRGVRPVLLRGHQPGDDVQRSH